MAEYRPSGRKQAQAGTRSQPWTTSTTATSRDTTYKTYEIFIIQHSLHLLLIDTPFTRAVPHRSIAGSNRGDEGLILKRGANLVTIILSILFEY